MKFEIKHCYTKATIYFSDCLTLAECVVSAVKSHANLSGADLSLANLYGADLSGADLYSAHLSGADLSLANLYGADLYGANLSSANLYSADLSDANLYGANLSSANLYGANLYGANLSSANLSIASLHGADLSSANLSGADPVVLARTQITPQEGAFVGYKKLNNDTIATLVIPHDALRLNAYGSRKCRASKVFVHAIEGEGVGYDKHTGNVLYEVGKEVIPDSFDEDCRVECSHGIHFFMRREEAEAY